MSKTSFTIAPARFPDDLDDTRRLFAAYVEALNLDLTFQGFAEELESLPGKYAPPHGELLLAKTAAGEAVGCVALRPLPGPGGCSEMKRLYLGPGSRGLGIGTALVRAILTRAAELGYREIRLDTLASMTKAIALYRSFGFVETARYYDTPLEADTLFLSRPLDCGTGSQSQQSG